MARAAAMSTSKAVPAPRRTRALVTRSRKAYTIGDFTVEGRPLGKGGYAFVHKVVSKRGATYAVKELRHAMRDHRDAVRRFQREFQVTSTLAHPNIVKMHECFEANGTWNIRMELIEGVSLEELVRSGERFDAAHAAALALPLLSALEFAHQHGAVHRDVKPGNILVSRAGVAKLTDFGIARLEDAQVTREGLLLGTPSYMSPEQLAGRRGADIDGRTDLYSLAVVLYELVARKHPHGLKPKSDIYEIIRIKNEQDAAPLTVEGAEALAPVVARALARNPEDRFASAGDMAAALKRVAASKRALKDELAKRVARAARAQAARGKRKRAVTPRDALAEMLAAAPWRRYAAVAVASAAALGLAAGLWVSRHPEAAARIEAAAQRTLEHTVIPVLERARGEAGEGR